MKFLENKVIIMPLLYTMALKDKTEKVSLFNDKPIAGSLTMTSVKIEKE